MVEVQTRESLNSYASRNEARNESPANMEDTNTNMEDTNTNMEDTNTNMEDTITKVQRIRRYISCSFNRKMFPAKAVYFAEYAKEGSHWPYLILFYVSIGLNPAQAGLVNGLRYIGSVIGAPLLGLLADKKRCHKKIAIVVCVLSILMTCLLPVAPFIVAHNMKNSTSVIHVRQQLNVSDTDNTSLFSVILAISFLGSTFDGSTMSFADSGVLQRINTFARSSNVGQQRYIAPVGYGIGSTLSSLAISYFQLPGISPYSGIFIIYLFVTSALAISYHFLYKGNVCVRSNTAEESRINADVNVNKVIASTFKKFKTWCLLLNVLLNGIPLALAYSFTFLYLEELGASTLLFGFANMVNGITAAFFFGLSKSIINKVGGTINGMSLSCFFWFIRFLSLSYMKNPLMILIINLLNGMTCSLFICAYIEFIKETYPMCIHTLMCGITSSLYNSLGYLLANVIGGEVYNRFGARRLFKTCAVICVTSSVIILLFGIVEKWRNKRNILNDVYATKDCVRTK